MLNWSVGLVNICVRVFKQARDDTYIERKKYMYMLFLFILMHMPLYINNSVLLRYPVIMLNSCMHG